MIVPRLRESGILAPFGHGARVHAILKPPFRASLYIDFQTELGDFPLWLVIQEQRVDACQMLIEEYNANVNEINK